jgi:hypothetical protein
MLSPTAQIALAWIKVDVDTGRVTRDDAVKAIQADLLRYPGYELDEATLKVREKANG